MNLNSKLAQVGGFLTCLLFTTAGLAIANDVPPAVLSFTASSRAVEANEEVTLTWSTEGASVVRIFPGGDVVEASGTRTVTLTESVVFELLAENSDGVETRGLGVVVDGASLPLRISEFVALNDGSLVRSDGSSPDWIELWNPNPMPIDSLGYRLSDDPSNPLKFSLPSTLVPADGFLIVDAEDLSLDGVIATNFSLDRSEGEFLGLTTPEGQAVDSITYPKQFADISYGRVNETSQLFFEQPTPGSSNGGLTVEGFVKDTKFSTQRGFYEETQTVEITTATPDAQIYYTLNGTEPGADNPSAILYENPLMISGTTTLRARAFREGWEPTDIDTQTYLFASQVGSQSPSPPSFPQQWIPNLTGMQVPMAPAFSHFEMNSDILASLPLQDLDGIDFELREALTSIPSISLVLDADVLFDPIDGLHVNAEQRGRAWERPVSFEVIDPIAGRNIQVNAGLRMHGGWNRFAEMLKKSFRVYFRSDYGDSKLEYPLFPGLGVEEFDRLILRSGNGKAWASPWRALAGSGNSLERVTYMRDQIVREYQAAMGNVAIPGTFVNLYINGQHWGIYNPVERPDENFAASRYGGNKDEYDVIKWRRGFGHEVAAGNNAAWLELIGLVRQNVADPSVYAQIEALLDLENFVDYIMLNFYVGNVDWVDNNVYAMRKRGEGEKFRFYCWDGEETFLSPATGQPTQLVVDSCLEIHWALRGVPEYQRLFGDRAHRHFFNGGALTPDETRKVLYDNADLLDRSIVAESARWGGLLRPAQPYDRDDWLAEVVNIDNNYLEPRVAATLAILIGDGLYPSVEAASFLPQHGGEITRNTPVSFAGGGGIVYYTTDGSDPRAQDGSVAESATAIEGSFVSRELIPFKSSWAYLDDGSDQGTSDVVEGSADYDVSNWKHPDFDDSGWGVGSGPLGYGRIFRTTLNTEIGFGSDPNNKHRTTYFRKIIDVPDGDLFRSLQGRFLRDDGVVIYLNGTEVARSGFSPSLTTITAETLAQEVGSAQEPTVYEFSVAPGLLRAGRNLIAVELHQSSPSSDDLGFDLELTGEGPGAGENLFLSDDTLLRSRVFHNGEWSALNEAIFTIGSRADDLVVSELMYHQADGGAEFFEIHNRGTVTRRLDDLQIVGGIQFNFGENGLTELAAGERIVLARRLTDYAAAYPNSPLAGIYSGGLANEGESFSLVDSEGEILWTLNYGIDLPWPSGVNGGGRSLIYQGGEISEASSWRASSELGGNPGTSDRVPLVSGSDLQSYALASQEGSIEGLEVSLNAGADDVLVVPEWSTDLNSWNDDGFILVENRTQPDGTVTKNWSLTAQVGRRFYRLRLIER